MRERRGLGWGIILLCFGIIMLLVNTGLMEWSVFRSFWVLWPLLLVVAGVSVLARHQRWVVVVAWVVFFAILITYGYFNTQPRAEGSHWGLPDRTLEAQAESGVDTAVLKLDVDAGDIDIGGGGDTLAQLDTNDRRLSLNTRTSGDTETVEVRANDYRFWGLGGLHSSVSLDESLPWEIELKSDAANTEVNMSELRVSRLTYDGDACNLRVQLSDNVDQCRISVHSDVSHITFVVPDNVGVRYTFDGDLRHVSNDNVKFTQDGNEYETEGYDTAAARVEIELRMDVGFVTFTR